MKRAVSIAEAKNRLPALVHEAEREPIELLRRGKPVAVVVSREQYDALVARRADAWQALQEFRERHELAALDLPGALDGTRDRSPGRRRLRW